MTYEELLRDAGLSSHMENDMTDDIRTREITSHRVNPANDLLTITVTDEPGAGGANHRYRVTGFTGLGNPSRDRQAEAEGEINKLVILFQNGPIAEAGVNGVTQEALLAIVADRLTSFQNGPYACQENADALRAVNTAIDRLHDRTRARMTRGVEGTNEK